MAIRDTESYPVVDAATAERFRLQTRAQVIERIREIREKHGPVELVINRENTQLAVVSDEDERASVHLPWDQRSAYRKDHTVQLTVTMVHIGIRTYVDAVLVLREENHYDDSDFYAMVWDQRTQEVRRVDYASTRYGGGGYAHADAVPEIKRKAAAWIATQYRRDARRAADQDMQKIQMGRFVKVIKPYHPRIKTRVPAEVGDYAYVFWQGSDQYSNAWRYSGVREENRFGIEFVGGDRDGQRTFITGADHFEIVNPAEYRRPEESIEAQATRIEAYAEPGYYLPYSFGEVRCWA